MHQLALKVASASRARLVGHVRPPRLPFPTSDGPPGGRWRSGFASTRLHAPAQPHTESPRSMRLKGALLERTRDDPPSLYPLTKTIFPTRSLRVSGSTRTIPLGPSGPGRAALPLDMTVSWAGAAGAASRSRSTSGSRMAARSSERSAGDGCLDPFARYRFLTGRRGAVRAPSRIRTRHAHAVPDPARQMMAQT